MSDATLLFDELLRLPNLRAKAYEVQERDGAMACVDLSARRGEDWFYARGWVSTRSGRRLLYWVLDEVESHGYRFRVRAGPPLGDPTAAREPWHRARENWAALTEEERRIHRELFPQEYSLLERGYDWDHQAVYRDGLPLSFDAVGRCLEEDGGFVHEWVCVRDEWTWRRYPLYALGPVATSLVTRADPESAPG